MYRTLKLTKPEQRLIEMATDIARKKVEAAEAERAEVVHSILEEHELPDGLTIDIKRDAKGEISIGFNSDDLLSDVTVAGRETPEPALRRMRATLGAGVPAPARVRGGKKLSKHNGRH